MCRRDCVYGACGDLGVYCFRGLRSCSLNHGQYTYNNTLRPLVSECIDGKVIYFSIAIANNLGQS